MTKRLRFKQTESLADRLTTFAKLMRERAEQMAPGTEKAAVLAKANKAEATADIDRWMRSSELKPPK
ncbi:MAG: hypothetical protein WBH00_18155 [Xanthobacteraceae bacterium]